MGEAPKAPPTVLAKPHVGSPADAPAPPFDASSCENGSNVSPRRALPTSPHRARARVDPDAAEPSGKEAAATQMPWGGLFNLLKMPEDNVKASLPVMSLKCVAPPPPTYPQSEIKPYLPIALMCTAAHRIPVSASTKQGPEKGDLTHPSPPCPSFSFPSALPPPPSYSQRWAPEVLVMQGPFEGWC